VDELDCFSRLVQLLQEAALGENPWDAVVSEIVAASGGSDGILFSPELPPSMGGFWASRAILPNHMETYATHYCSKDVWRQSQPSLYCLEGRLITDEELIDPVSMQRSKVYCGFLKQLEVGRLVCGVVLPSDSPTLAGGLLLSIFKPMHEEGFDVQQQDLVRRLLPHVRAAFNTWRILGAHQRMHELSCAALNALATAALLIDRESRIFFANEAAERLFTDADGLAMLNGSLVGATFRETARIQAFVAGLFAPLNGTPGIYVHPVARPSRKRAYACFAHPLLPGAGMYGVTSTPATLLFIRDPSSRCVLEAGVLQQLYGLSRCEALLAGLLAHGMTLDDAAATRGISYETARCQLKNVFGKTGCCRQAELVAFLGNGCRP
jgi:DNA-binding CsgD family transcriptional regulator/PAS domain-containing protein